MKNAKILIWVGPAYEQPLFKHVKQLENSVLTLQDDSSIKLKPLRTGTFWDEKSCCAHGHHEAHDHHHEKSDATNLDGHIWLDPLMMTQVVDAILQHLKKLYPNNQGLLSRNANDYKKRLEALHQDLLKKMKPYKG